VCRYELRMLQSRGKPFRAPMLRRGYASAGLYNECVQHLPWQQAVVRRRNNQTGELAVTGVPSNRQDFVRRGLCSGLSCIDGILSRLRRDLDIEDPDAMLVGNWYPDGKSTIGAHTHDHWSAILSIGCSRVFLLDEQPIILNDGDLLVFGTQRHGVPKMPDVVDGRVSLGVFWYPEKRSSGTACCRCAVEIILLQQASDGKFYCEACWHQFLNSMQTQQDDVAASEDQLLEAALQMSLLQQ